MPDRNDALIAALVELEHHVGDAGWDQPARLFALVRTDELIAVEPELADHLGLRSSAEGFPDGALSSIEQEDFRAGGGTDATADAPDEADLPRVLARIGWPDAVSGCALTLERSFLPARYETELPEDPAAALAYVARHEHRQNLRLVVGVLRDGSTYALARLMDQPGDLLSGPELAPGVASVLAATLAEDESEPPADRPQEDRP